MPVAEVNKFFEAEDAMYPSISKMQDSWLEEVEQNKVISNYRTPKGYPAKVSYLQSLTGKRYGYLEEDTPKNLQLFAAFIEASRSNPDLRYEQFKQYGQPKPTGFKPTKIKNYKVIKLARLISNY